MIEDTKYITAILKGSDGGYYLVYNENNGCYIRVFFVINIDDDSTILSEDGEHEILEKILQAIKIEKINKTI